MTNLSTPKQVWQSSKNRDEVDKKNSSFSYTGAGGHGIGGRPNTSKLHKRTGSEGVRNFKKKDNLKAQ
jgi:hypothetical protein